MATFNYAVRDKAGRIVKGRLDGDSKEAVQAKLSQMGYIILELDQIGGLGFQPVVGVDRDARGGLQALLARLTVPELFGEFGHPSSLAPDRTAYPWPITAPRSRCS